MNNGYTGDIIDQIAQDLFVLAEKKRPGVYTFEYIRKQVAIDPEQWDGSNELPFPPGLKFFDASGKIVGKT
jgi:hypothetical protein